MVLGTVSVMNEKMRKSTMNLVSFSSALPGIGDGDAQ
jgi:hypothetical protein